MHFARRLSYRYLDLTRIFSPFHRNLKLLILLFSISSPAIVLYEIDQNIANPTDSDSKPYILISIYIYINFVKIDGSTDGNSFMAEKPMELPGEMYNPGYLL